MKIDSTNLLLLIAVCFYFVGAIIIPYNNIAFNENEGIKQKQLAYIDNDGEEHEEDGLIEIEGVGYVLSYKDIYLSTLPFLIVSCILAKIIFDSTDELKFMIFTNCILGIFLIVISTKNNLISTILYWCGIVTASNIPSRKLKGK